MRASARCVRALTYLGLAWIAVPAILGVPTAWRWATAVSALSLTTVPWSFAAAAPLALASVLARRRSRTLVGTALLTGAAWAVDVVAGLPAWPFHRHVAVVFGGLALVVTAVAGLRFAQDVGALTRGARNATAAIGFALAALLGWLQLAGLPAPAASAATNGAYVDADGGLWAWGDVSKEHREQAVSRVTAPASPRFAHASWRRFTCYGIDVLGRVWAWGDGERGELGNGWLWDWQRTATIAMPRGIALADVAAGSSFGLALDRSGQAWAWGSNWAGQLGTGDRNDRSRPVRVRQPPGVRFVAVSAGDGHGVALDAEGRAWAWGWGYQGQLGDGGLTDRLVPGPVRMPDGARLDRVAAGGFHAIALATDGRAWVWGMNQTGDVSAPDHTTPVRFDVPDDVRLTGVAATAYATVGLDTEGRLWIWGAPRTRNEVWERPILVATPAGTRVASLATGASRVAVFDAAGAGWVSRLALEVQAADPDWLALARPQASEPNR